MRAVRPRSLLPPNEPRRDFQLSLSAWVRLISRQAVTALGAEAPANGLTGRRGVSGGGALLGVVLRRRLPGAGLDLLLDPSAEEPHVARLDPPATNLEQCLESDLRLSVPQARLEGSNARELVAGLGGEPLGFALQVALVLPLIALHPLDADGAGELVCDVLRAAAAAAAFGIELRDSLLLLARAIAVVRPAPSDLLRLGPDDAPIARARAVDLGDALDGTVCREGDAPIPHAAQPITRRPPAPASAWRARRRRRS